MNPEKNSNAKLIDTAARTAGIAMAILIYGSIVMTVARFEANSAFIDMPLICYLIPGLFGCVFGMGAGMGLAYGMSILTMPDEIAWLAIALDALFSTLFYAGCLAMLIALVSGPLFVVFACFPFSCGLGYWIIARWRSRRRAVPETK